MQIDTSKVSNHRKLRFDSIDDCLTEVDQILLAAQNGTLSTTGNWTPGQILAHVAAWIEYGYTGYPLRQVPFFVRWVMHWKVNSILNKGMPRAVRIPGVKGGTVGLEDLPVTEAGERLRAALNRLRSGKEAIFDSPAFGAMSHEDRIRLNLRHAELHLGYLNY